MNTQIVVLISASLPVIALSYCFVFPLIVDFRGATRTHCQNKNFFPSVSAAISYNGSTMLLWALLLSVHTPFRFKLAKRTYQTYMKLFQKIYDETDILSNSNDRFSEFNQIKSLLYVTYQVNKIEIIGLLILSLFPSMTNYDLHKLGFSTYLLAASFFTISVCSIERRLSIAKMPNSYNVKKKLGLSFTLSLLLAITMFIWHNSYCTSYVYSFFGLFEVILILSNVCFHSWSYFIIKIQESMEVRTLDV